MAQRAIEFNTEEEANTRSHNEAVDRGCPPSDVTQYWWNVSESTVGTWCCWIGDDVVPDTVVMRTPYAPPLN